MKKYKSVEEYVQSLDRWQDEVIRLREIVQTTGLEETLKWSMPVYTLNGKNVTGIFAPKGYFGLWFYQGALLADLDKVLVNAQEGKTKALRQWRFTEKKQLKVRAIKKYINEAKSLVLEGKEIKPNRSKALVIPTELRSILSKDRELKLAFDGLSESCRREYADYISEAKKPETRQRRLAKIAPMILEAMGLNDRYRK